MDTQFKKTCSGHCCRAFSIRYSPAEVMQNFVLPKDDPQRRPGIDQLQGMLVYLGEFPANPLMRIKGESWAAKGLRIAQKDNKDNTRLMMEMEEKPYGYRPDLKQHFYACKHVQLNGDCGIYANRPEMCRDYPNGHDCAFAECTWDLEEQRKFNEQLLGKRHLPLATPMESRSAEKDLCSNDTTSPVQSTLLETTSSRSSTPMSESSPSSPTGATTPTSGLTQAKSFEPFSPG